MTLALLLSGECIDLAVAEAAMLAGSISDKLRIRLLGSRTLLLDGDCGGCRCSALNASASRGLAARLIARLAFTRAAYFTVFISKPSEAALMRAFSRVDWLGLCRGSFCVRVKHISKSGCPLVGVTQYPTKQNRGLGKSSLEKELADIVWRALPRPKVDLEQPDTEIVVIIDDNKTVCGIKLAENTEDFESRSPVLRPGFQPDSLHPKLARAMVNLSGIHGRATLLDPFCGSGGILIEAGLMGFPVRGYDVSPGAVKKCLLNMKHFGIKNYKISCADACNLRGSYSYIVTDLPYGRNSKAIVDGKTASLDNLYSRFLKQLGRVLKKRAVTGVCEASAFALSLPAALSPPNKSKARPWPPPPLSIRQGETQNSRHSPQGSGLKTGGWLALAAPTIASNSCQSSVSTFRKLINQAGLTLKDGFSYYVHRSMTKCIIVVDKR